MVFQKFRIVVKAETSNPLFGMGKNFSSLFINGPFLTDRLPCGGELRGKGEFLNKKTHILSVILYQNGRVHFGN
jgi:hypothetical protein